MLIDLFLRLRALFLNGRPGIVPVNGFPSHRTAEAPPDAPPQGHPLRHQFFNSHLQGSLDLLVLGRCLRVRPVVTASQRLSEGARVACSKSAHTVAGLRSPGRSAWSQSGDGAMSRPGVVPFSQIVGRMRANEQPIGQKCAWDSSPKQGTRSSAWSVIPSTRRRVRACWHLGVTQGG
jgi:hypothetical protein